MFEWWKTRNKEKFPTWSDIPPPETNVVKFPEPKAVPPKEDRAGKAHYKLGLTDNNRVAFQMGFSEVTMNKYGCRQMIDQLTFYMNQLRDEEVEDAE